jgi:hypothetical protein
MGEIVVVGLNLGLTRTNKMVNNNVDSILFKSPFPYSIYTSESLCSEKYFKSFNLDWNYYRLYNKRWEI